MKIFLNVLVLVFSTASVVAAQEYSTRDQRIELLAGDAHDIASRLTSLVDAACPDRTVACGVDASEKSGSATVQYECSWIPSGDIYECLITHESDTSDVDASVTYDVTLAISPARQVTSAEEYRRKNNGYRRLILAENEEDGKILCHHLRMLEQHLKK